MRKPKILVTGSTGRTGTPERIGGRAPQSLPKFVRANRARFTGELQEVS